MKPRIPRFPGLLIPALAFSIVYGCTVERKAASLNKSIPKATIGLPPAQEIGHAAKVLLHLAVPKFVQLVHQAVQEVTVVRNNN